MIEINWGQDDRNIDVNKYLVDPLSDNQSRRKAFLRGWTIFLSQGGSDYLDRVSWEGLGMVYASILGDVALNQRKDLYRLLLHQFTVSDRVSHWSDEQRREVLFDNVTLGWGFRVAAMAQTAGG